jgi:hypothetical protein
MSAKAIHEAKGKQLLWKHLKQANLAPIQCATFSLNSCWNTLCEKNPWLNDQVYACNISFLKCLFLTQRHTILMLRFFFEETCGQTRSVDQAPWQNGPYQSQY